MLIPIDGPFDTNIFLATTPEKEAVTVMLAKASWKVEEDGTLVLMDTHSSIQSADTRYGDTEDIKLESDLVTYKPHTDLIFIDPKAVALKKLPVAEFAAQITTTGRKVNIRACGPRMLYRNIAGVVSISKPEKVTSVPLRFSYSYGGSAFSDGKPIDCEHRNPIGRGYSVLKGFSKEEPGPQVWWMDRPFSTSSGKSNQPAGLNPIDKTWLPRRVQAGTFDDNWKKSKFPYLPDDFKWEFNNSSTENLQLTFEEAIGPIMIKGLSKKPIFFRFGKDNLMLFVNATMKESEPLLAAIDTIIVSPETRLVDVIWRTVAPTEWYESTIALKLTRR